MGVNVRVRGHTTTKHLNGFNKDTDGRDDVTFEEFLSPETDKWCFDIGVTDRDHSRLVYKTR